MIDYNMEDVSPPGYDITGMAITSTNKDLQNHSLHYTMDPRLEENAVTYLINKARKDELVMTSSHLYWQ